MKKTIIMSVMAMAFIAYVPEVQAQGFLNKVADKAKGRIEQKLESTVENALGKVINGEKAKSPDNDPNKSAPHGPGNNNGETVTSRGVFSAGEDPFRLFVDDLSAPKSCMFFSGAFDELDIKDDDNPQFNSFAEAYKAFPPLPTVEQIIIKDTAPAQAMHNFKKGCEYLSAIVAETVTNAQLKAKAQTAEKKTTAGSAQQARMDAGAMQIFQLMQKYGIDPENVSDKEIEEFVKKMILSGELQMAGKGAVIDMNYTEEKETEIDRISAKIEILEDKVSAFVTENGYNILTPGHDTELHKLYAELQATWSGSEACKQVYDIEKEIDRRVLEYIRNHPDYANNGAVIEYPDFWVKGREKENEIIRDFNLTSAEKWIGALKETYDAQASLIQEIAVSDAELESAFPNKEDLTYAVLKQRIHVLFQQMIINLPVIAANSYGLPLVQSVSEKNTIGQ